MGIKKEWFEDERFWESFAPIMFDEDRWAEVPAVADGALRLSGLEDAGNARILDLCCGMGRIANEFSRRGFAVTGVDITPSYLEAAKENAAYEGLDGRFILNDVRSFREPDAFDLAVNLYTSFGYFENPADDELFVRNACDSLKSGGVFIIETQGKELAVRDFVDNEWFERAGFTVLTEYFCVDSWAGLGHRWILIKDGKRLERSFVRRLYSAAELRYLFLEAGFSAVHTYGEWDGSPYDQDARMMITVGIK
ncbi:class I SAM-dependent methyltransferase [Breznakiella homolactica]|uniref:Class I SAM-dependent methyltransferase n=1 Tax=Breznakiella homolactica TaxID=2798577 RepID=A0A7T8B9W9_9SPIR|nr:class I SAM-dependent methyltransferase [Breznakiella homolactica]QQO08927.1 class I SAM-dependent methyltransferase [Breznakiella homolactica]